MTHGRYGAYVMGCRCAACRAAATEYHRQRRGGARIPRSWCRQYLTTGAKPLARRAAERALDAGRCRRRCQACDWLWTPKGKVAAEQPCPRCGDTGLTRGAA